MTYMSPPPSDRDPNQPLYGSQPGGQPPAYGTPPYPYPYPPVNYSNQPGYRPGCVTVYVVLLLFGLPFLLCAGIAFMFMRSNNMSQIYGNTYNCYESVQVSWGGATTKTYCGPLNEIYAEMLEDTYGTSIQVIGTVAVAMSVVQAFTAYGLWKMKKWGLTLYFVANGLGILLNLLFLAQGNCFALPGIATVAIVMAWFVRNRWRFV